jgi:drug/metabolite transporter (DMT)-like permease
MLVVCLIWGSNYVVNKAAIQKVPPLQFAALRYVLASLVLAVMARMRSSSEPPLPRKTFWQLALLGLLGHTANQVGFLYGLKYTTATNSALLFATLPIVVASLSTFLSVETPGRNVWAGIVIGMLGVAAVLGARGVHFTAATRWGDFLTLVAMASWALFMVGVRHVARGVSSFRVTTITTVAGMPGLLALALPGMANVPWTRLGAGPWLAMVYVVFLSSIVALVLWSRSVQALGSSRTALYNCVTPVVTGAVSWFALGERPVPLQLLGAGLVLVGVAVSQLRWTWLEPVPAGET